MRVKQENKGFALVELLLLVVIVAAIAGVGYYVIHQKHASDKLLSSTNTNQSSKAPSGTSASVEQLTEDDAKTETKVDNSADSSVQHDSTSANSAVGNVGGAYNEANY